MAQFKSIVSSVKSIWQTPEQAVYAEEDINNAFESTTLKVAPSTDTLSADNITNSFVNDFAEPAKISVSEEKIYANDSYNGDGYEDLTDPTFTVAKSAKGDDTMPTFVEYEIKSDVVASQPAKVQPVRAAFDDFVVNTSFLFSGKTTNSVPAEAPKEIKIEKPATNQVKASVGFNTASASTNPTPSYTASKVTSSARPSSSDKYSVQVLRPTNVEDVNEACTLLKEGNVVMAVLSGIGDRNARLRYLDYLSGCCKGCDADFKEIVKVDSIDAVLIASPRGIGIKFPVPAAAEPAAPAQASTTPASNASAFANVFGTTNEAPVSRPSAFSSVFGNVDLGGGEGQKTNWYTDKF